MLIETIETLLGYVEMQIRDGDWRAPSVHAGIAREMISKWRKDWL